MEINQFRKETEKLLKFFEKDYDYPEKIKLSNCETIGDARLFVEAHVNSVRAHSENKYFRCELDRLIWMRRFVQDNKLKCIGERKYEYKARVSENKKGNNSQKESIGNLRDGHTKTEHSKPAALSAITPSSKPKQQPKKVKGKQIDTINPTLF